MPIIITSASAETEGLVLDGLDLNDGTIYGLTALQLPIPRKRPEWIEGVDADGALLMRDPLVSNGQLIATIDLHGADRDATHILVGQIVDKLEEAERNPGGIPCVWTPANGSESLTFYVLTGEITELPVDIKWLVANVPTVTVTMDCRPGRYGDEISAGTATVSGPLTTLVLNDAQGDMPSDEARLIITEGSSQNRRHVEWGQEYLHFNAASPSSLILDSDSLVTSGYTGTQSTRSGAYDPNASGDNTLIATGGAAVWIALASTGSQPHIGTFRVFARVAAAATDYFRLSWQVGDGLFHSNPPAVVPVSGEWSELDLGLITIPEATLGTQSWTGRVDAYLPSSANVYLDYIAFIPAGEGHGRVRTGVVNQPGIVVARDDFTGTTSGNALNARVAPAGGTWATSGAATDFTFVDTLSGSGVAAEAVTRATFNEASRRLAILGSTNYTDVAVRVNIRRESGFNLPVAGEYIMGVIARYVDASNYLRLEQAVGPITTTLRLQQVVAGVVTTLATSTVSTSMMLEWRSLSLSVTAGGVATGRLYAGAALLSTVIGSSTTLATSGTLDDGLVGLLDQNSWTAGTTDRYYDDFAVEQIPAEPIALYSGRTLEIRSASTIRQNSAGTIYGSPPYRGGRFILHPAGVEDRSTRIAVKAHRNDVATTAAGNIADSLTLEARYRPRYSVVPRT